MSPREASHGTVNLTGTQISTTGSGSGGVVTDGTGSTLNGTNLTIKINSAYDAVNGWTPAGVDNQSFEFE